MVVFTAHWDFYTSTPTSGHTIDQSHTRSHKPASPFVKMRGGVRYPPITRRLAGGEWRRTLSHPPASHLTPSKSHVILPVLRHATSTSTLQLRLLHQLDNMRQSLHSRQIQRRRLSRSVPRSVEPMRRLRARHLQVPVVRSND